MWQLCRNQDRFVRPQKQERQVGQGLGVLLYGQGFVTTIGWLIKNTRVLKGDFGRLFLCLKKVKKFLQYILE